MREGFAKDWKNRLDFAQNLLRDSCNSGSGISYRWIFTTDLYKTNTNNFILDRKVFLSSRHSSKNLQFLGNECWFTVKAWFIYFPWDYNWLLLFDAVICLNVLINIASLGTFFSAPSDTAEFTPHCEKQGREWTLHWKKKRKISKGIQFKALAKKIPGGAQRRKWGSMLLFFSPHL